jgi:hypothetical protein
MKYLLLILILLTPQLNELWSSEILNPYLGLGGGYTDGKKYHGGIFQIEYLLSKYHFKLVRPEAIFVSPLFKAFFFGMGARAEIRVCKHILFNPSFVPGLYVKGSWRDLGFPLEFRSCLEFAYEFTNKSRIGLQISHISNGSLSQKNPGLNSFTAILAKPLSSPN